MSQVGNPIRFPADPKFNLSNLRPSGDSPNPYLRLEFNATSLGAEGPSVPGLWPASPGKFAPGRARRYARSIGQRPSSRISQAIHSLNPGASCRRAHFSAARNERCRCSQRVPISGFPSSKKAPVGRPATKKYLIISHLRRPWPQKRTGHQREGKPAPMTGRFFVSDRYACP